MIKTITLKNVGKKFSSPLKTISVLNEVSLTIRRGSMIIIFGPSGSGKSTLLSLMGCIELPTEGEIYYDNLKISTTSPKDRVTIRKDNFSFIFQNFALIDGLTITENLDHNLLIHGRKDPEKRFNIISNILSKLKLTNRADYFPYELSGGEKQRIAFARAITTKPSFIFADEPTGRLDLKNAIDTLKLLMNCTQESDSGIVIFTHDSRIDFLQKKIELYLLEYGRIKALY